MANPGDREPSQGAAPPPGPSRRWLFVLAAAGGLLLDQLTKAWARGALAGGPLVLLDGLLSLELRRNPGVAFSVFRDAGQVGRFVLGGLGLLVGVWLAVHVARRRDARPLELFGMGLIASGAVGNGLDRLVAGVVTDFVVLGSGRLTWPAFNVADAALAVGVVAVLVALRHQRHSEAPRAPGRRASD